MTVNRDMKWLEAEVVRLTAENIALRLWQNEVCDLMARIVATGSYPTRLLDLLRRAGRTT